ncbi:dinitrogenase iron-molybdenum cofactor biosynthesis protein [bacterium]|nr:dinitrogenase iron-molybdenum cofactor biosynthesis protein [bacterium]MBU1884089.1 dinitrogenase iron-molybdenum cofactor biosynthesis protein [bacterium]
MRIVYPTNEDMGFLSKRGAHFGKAKFYTVITLDDGKIIEVEVIKNPGHDAGGCGNAVTNIMDLHPDALIVSGIGASPAKGFMNVGLELYFDENSTTVKESIDSFVRGSLRKISSGTCETH